jgi:hypothetical protein
MTRFREAFGKTVNQTVHVADYQTGAFRQAFIFINHPLSRQSIPARNG